MKKKRIFFLTTDSNVPSGGRLFIYHLVDILVTNGVDAYALHQKKNFRYTWFSNSIPVSYSYQIKRARIRSGKIKHWFRFYVNVLFDVLQAPKPSTSKALITVEDVLVLPATRTSFCNEILPGVPKVSLSQNSFLLLQSGGLKNPESSIYHPDIKARIAMSKLNYDVHCLLFPEKNVWEVPVFIDAGLYHFSAAKKRRIAYMPRRLSSDSKGVINLLNLRGNLHGFEFVAIDGMTPQKVADVMSESLIFLSFSHREGFGLPPAEAMACGCIVIGYSGNGGDEFFAEDVCFRIPDGDLVSFALKIEEVIAEYDNAPERLDQLRRRASDRILQNYSRNRTETVFLQAWSEIMELIQ